MARLGGSSTHENEKLGLDCRALRGSGIVLFLKMKEVGLDCGASRGLRVVLFMKMKNLDLTTALHRYNLHKI